MRCADRYLEASSYLALKSETDRQHRVSCVLARELQVSKTYALIPAAPLLPGFCKSQRVEAQSGMVQVPRGVAAIRAVMPGGDGLRLLRRLSRRLLVGDGTLQSGPPFIQDATIYNVERFLSWVTTTDNDCAALTRAALRSDRTLRPQGSELRPNVRFAARKPVS